MYRVYGVVTATGHRIVRDVASRSAAVSLVRSWRTRCWARCCYRKLREGRYAR